MALEASLRRASAEVDASPRRRVSRARFDAAFGKAPIGMALLRPDRPHPQGQCGALRSDRLLARPARGDRAEPGFSAQASAPPLDDSLDAVARGQARRASIRARPRTRGWPRGPGAAQRLARSRIDDGQPDELVAHLHDLSADAGADAEPPRLTEHDPLTGLYSPERFEQELRTELDAAARYSTLRRGPRRQTSTVSPPSTSSTAWRAATSSSASVANAFARRLRSHRRRRAAPLGASSPSCLRRASGAAGDRRRRGPASTPRARSERAKTERAGGAGRQHRDRHLRGRPRRSAPRSCSWRPRSPSRTPSRPVVTGR